MGTHLEAAIQLITVFQESDPELLHRLGMIVVVYLADASFHQQSKAFKELLQPLEQISGFARTLYDSIW